MYAVIKCSEEKNIVAQTTGDRISIRAAIKRAAAIMRKGG